MMRHLYIAIAAVAFFAGSPVRAQNVEQAPKYYDLIHRTLPVTEGDVTDRPYRVLGSISATVHGRFFHDPRVISVNQDIYKEIWERAKKMGADAAIHVKYTAVDKGFWAITAHRYVDLIQADAVKFLTDEEIANLPITDVESMHK